MLLKTAPAFSSSIFINDFAFARRSYVCTPEKIVGGFQLARLLEAKDPHPLCIHRFGQVSYDAVLAAGFHSLQNDLKKTDLQST